MTLHLCFTSHHPFGIPSACVFGLTTLLLASMHMRYLQSFPSSQRSQAKVCGPISLRSPSVLLEAPPYSCAARSWAILPVRHLHRKYLKERIVVSDFLSHLVKWAIKRMHCEVTGGFIIGDRTGFVFNYILHSSQVYPLLVVQLHNRLIDACKPGSQFWVSLSLHTKCNRLVSITDVCIQVMHPNILACNWWHLVATCYLIAHKCHHWSSAHWELWEMSRPSHNLKATWNMDGSMWYQINNYGCKNPDDSKWLWNLLQSYFWATLI